MILETKGAGSRLKRLSSSWTLLSEAWAVYRKTIQTFSGPDCRRARPGRWRWSWPKSGCRSSTLWSNRMQSAIRRLRCLWRYQTFIASRCMDYKNSFLTVYYRVGMKRLAEHTASRTNGWTDQRTAQIGESSSSEAHIRHPRTFRRRFSLSLSCIIQPAGISKAGQKVANRFWKFFKLWILQISTRHPLGQTSRPSGSISSLAKLLV